MRSVQTRIRQDQPQLRHRAMWNNWDIQVRENMLLAEEKLAETGQSVAKQAGWMGWTKHKNKEKRPKLSWEQSGNKTLGCEETEGTDVDVYTIYPWGKKQQENTLRWEEKHHGYIRRNVFKIVQETTKPKPTTWHCQTPLRQMLKLKMLTC